MAMTRRDYETVAQAIRDEIVAHPADIDQDIRAALRNLANRLAGTFAINPRFDEDRFLTACDRPRYTA